MANLFLDAGFKKGDSVALLMENRPEYNCLWLGMAKVGVLPALINTNLRNDSLVHSVTVASCKAIIFGQELEQGLVQLDIVQYIVAEH